MPLWNDRIFFIHETAEELLPHPREKMKSCELFKIELFIVLCTMNSGKIDQNQTRKIDIS